VWLPWDTAALISIGLAALGLLGRRARRSWLVVGATVAREAAIVLGLYAIWQEVGGLAVTKVSGAVAHAMWIWHAENFLHLPSEVSVQRAALPHPLLIQAFNAYYAIVHVPALIIFLIWLFVRHRDQYGRWRELAHSDDPRRTAAAPPLAWLR
jgi:hypothetical protein